MHGVRLRPSWLGGPAGKQRDFSSKPWNILDRLQSHELPVLEVGDHASAGRRAPLPCPEQDLVSAKLLALRWGCGFFFPLRCQQTPWEKTLQGHTQALREAVRRPGACCVAALG